MEEAKLVAASAIALAVTLFSIFSLRPVARRLGLVDKPGGRKAHKGRVPLIGGLCFFLGTVAGLTYLGYVDAFVASLLVPCALIVMTGAVDDLNNMSVRSRLIIQACTAWLVIGATGIYLDSAGHLLGEGIDLQLGLLGIPITIVAVIGLVNAFNMMDGIDGLAAGMAMVSIGTILLFAGGSWPALGVVLLLQVLFAALVPYLAVNLGWPDGRKIFMGDAGSTLIGFLMAWSLIYLSHGKVGVLAPVDTLWCIAIPVMDTIGVMHRRMRLGRSPFEPDRQHLHHLLCDAGFSSRATLGIIVLAGLLLGGLGYALRNLPEVASLGAFAFVFALYLARLPQAIEALGRAFAKPQVAIVEHVPATAVFASTPAMVDAAPSQPGLMRALCVLNASSDAAQIAPIAEQMARDGRFDARVVIAATDDAQSEGVLGLFDLAPDVRVTLASADDDAQVTSAALGTLDRLLSEFRPDVVVVPAGAPTSVATTLAATYQHIPVACVEAAGAPGGRDVLDASRKVMGSLAAMHFTATESVGRSLVADGVPSDRVVVTGDPAARTLHTAVDRLHEDEQLQRALTQRFGFLRENAPLLLVLGREKMGERLEPLARALRRIALRRPDYDIVCLLPPSRNMDGIDGMLGAFANIHLVAPGDYTAFAYLADAAYLTLAVAGECAAEAAPLGKPVLLLNGAGEPGLNASPLTSEMPNVRRIDVHEQTISDVVLNLMSDRRAWEMLRNDERPRVDACERIVEALAAMRPSPATVVPLVPAAGLPRFERVRGVS